MSWHQVAINSESSPVILSFHRHWKLLTISSYLKLFLSGTIQSGYSNIMSILCSSSDLLIHIEVLFKRPHNQLCTHTNTEPKLIILLGEVYRGTGCRNDNIVYILDYFRNAFNLVVCASLEKKETLHNTIPKTRHICSFSQICKM